MTIAIFRLPQYRAAFLEKMKELANADPLPDNLPLTTVDGIAFSPSFFDKYIDIKMYERIIQALPSDTIDIARHPSEGFHTISTWVENPIPGESTSFSGISQMPSEGGVGGESLALVEEDQPSILSMNLPSLDERDLKSRLI